jgi:hypothetical protein
MSFDVCQDCSGTSDWGDAFRLALAWALPTVLWVLYRQLDSNLLNNPGIAGLDGRGLNSLFRFRPRAFRSGGAC